MKRINPNGVAVLAKDIRYLTEFVDTLGNPILRENLDELQQTVMLMQAENSDEFYDVSTRNKKYGRVDAMNGPLLLEKYVIGRYPANYYLMTLEPKHIADLNRLTNVMQSPVKTDKFTVLSSRFGIKS